MNWFKRIFTLPSNTKIILQHLVDGEIDSIFEHNTPDAIAGKLSQWVNGTAIGGNLLAGTAAQFAIGQLRDLLLRNETDAAKAKFKAWVYGRLGINA
jgi:hypothetical protein